VFVCVLYSFFFKQKTAYDFGLGIPAEPLFRSSANGVHLGFLAGQIGRLITISTTPVIAGDSFEMDAVGALRLSPLHRGLAIDSKIGERRVGKEGRSEWSTVYCNNSERSIDSIV